MHAGHPALSRLSLCEKPILPLRRRRHGRSRSNVWNYRGVNTFGAGRMEELRSHPTVKPIALVADAMRDCTRRRDAASGDFTMSWLFNMAFFQMIMEIRT